MVLTRLLAVLALASCSALPASARPVTAWYADALTEQADVVVMATVHSTRDGRDFSTEQHKFDDLVPVITTFYVDAVLKGNVPGKISSPEGIKIEVEHQRYFGPLGYLTLDGPSLASFDSRKPTRYLVFLKKHGDSFVPVTGLYETDQSFVELGRYFSFHRETTRPVPTKPTEPQTKPVPDPATQK